MSASGTASDDPMAVMPNASGQRRARVRIATGSTYRAMPTLQLAPEDMILQARTASSSMVTAPNGGLHTQDGHGMR